MSEAILKSSSINNPDKHVRINKDQSTVYIDTYYGGEVMQAHFTTLRADWESFILSEVAELR